MGRPQSTSQSNKDYCKKYREKNKEVLKPKERSRKKFSRDYEKYTNTEKYQEFQFLNIDRIRTREYRRRKKAELNCQTETAPSTPTTSANPSTP